MQDSQRAERPALRRISRVVRGIATSDGAGVELTRVIGQPALPELVEEALDRVRGAVGRP